MVSKSSRVRRLERERAERRMARLAAHQMRRRRIQAGIAGSLALALLVFGTTWLLGLFEEDQTPVALPNCTWTPREAGEGITQTGLPASVVPSFGERELVITTNLGEIRATVDLSEARCGIASVNFLALQGYYNNTTCHKLDTTLYTLRCGSKDGQDNSGPEYQFPNEGLPRPAVGTVSPAPDPSASPDADPNSYYPRGAVLLSNLDVNATGSQIIFVYRDGTALPAEYTQIGRVVEGLEVIEQVAAAGVVDSAAVGKPDRDLTFSSVRLADPEPATPEPTVTPTTAAPSGTS